MDAGLHTDERDGWLVLSLRGDLDLAGAPLVRSRLRAATADRSRPVVVDLDAVGVLDSIGLGLLVGIRRRVEAAGGRLVVVSSVERHRRLLELSGLDRAFPVVATLDEAMTAP